MNNVVHLCDCMEFMKSMPSNAYDLAIVDPPYGIGNFTRYTSHNKKISRNYSVPRLWNNVTPPALYFEELKRISDRQIVFGANYYNCFSGGALVWDKGARAETLSRCEIASLSFQNRVDYIEVYSPSGFVDKAERIHPCQKPVNLYRKILYKYAKHGDRIFDSHVGSGSIRIACHDMGFDFEGCEIDRDYWEAQEERYQAHASQGVLFEPEEINQPVAQDLIDIRAKMH